MCRIYAALGIAVALAAVMCRPAAASEIRFLCPPSLKSVMTEIVPQFEKRSGDKVSIVYVVMPTMKRQIDGGAKFDVAILPPDLMDELIRAGKVTASSRTPIARTAIGVAVKSGSPHPDISTVEATKRMLQQAKSISYTANGAVGNAFLAMLQKLNLTAEVGPKLKAMVGGNAVSPVAKGQAELAITTVPGILEIPGVDFVGRLPSELQHYVDYTAGVSSKSQDGSAAADFIQALTTSNALAVIKSKGLDPVGR